MEKMNAAANTYIHEIVGNYTLVLFVTRHVTESRLTALRSLSEYRLPLAFRPCVHNVLLNGQTVLRQQVPSQVISSPEDVFAGKHGIYDR